PDKGVSTTNITKRFEVVCICLDLSCHDMILVNLTSASGGCEVACFMLTYLMYCLVKLYHFEVKYRTPQEKEGAGVGLCTYLLFSLFKKRSIQDGFTIYTKMCPFAVSFP